MITPMRQKFTLLVKDADTLYGPTYKEVQDVPGRCAYETTIVHVRGGSDRGKEVVCRHILRTAYPLSPGDFIVIDGARYPIQTVEACVGVGGEVIEYEAKF